VLGLLLGDVLGLLLGEVIGEVLGEELGLLLGEALGDELGLLIGTACAKNTPVKYAMFYYYKLNPSTPASAASLFKVA
jgi:hypothetical protein